MEISHEQENHKAMSITKKSCDTKLFTKKESFYYKMIDKFFRHCNQVDINKMLQIINGESEISLRILDWFVTRYSKKKIDFENLGDDAFDIHISYKAQLKSYKKRYFDPFRRRKKFYYNYNKEEKDKTIYTTIGQLNFFRWAISNNIVDYVEANLVNVTKAMNTSNKEDKKKKKDKKDKSSSNDDSSDDSSDDSCDDDEEIESSTKKSNGKIVVKKSKKSIKVKANKCGDDDEVQILLDFD
jgi:hypothetical protein